jgi:Putative prokaryotic signal transducing protein
MSIQHGSGPQFGPSFCPACGIAWPANFEQRLCPECGETLLAQGYCPVCESRWRLAVGAVCPKHDLPLEAGEERTSLPYGLHESVSWLTVKVLPNSLAAAVPRARLEAEGIPTFLEGERMGSAGMYPAATAGVKLQVPADHAAQARIILSQNWSLPSDEKDDFEDLL